ncbi:MAG: hypothetical protein NZ761_08305, partial [Dehalococcoidia bacterium]|nr:hypothetical protein [Dehalococcoidia bacterium]
VEATGALRDALGFGRAGGEEFGRRQLDAEGSGPALGPGVGFPERVRFGTRGKTGALVPPG